MISNILFNKTKEVIAAVSDLKRLLPRLKNIIPFSFINPNSFFENPPSGPIIIFIGYFLGILKDKRFRSASK